MSLILTIALGIVLGFMILGAIRLLLTVLPVAWESLIDYVLHKIDGWGLLWIALFAVLVIVGVAEKIKHKP